MNATPHTSVLLDEVLNFVAPQDGEIYVDGTFGAGGYSRALLAAADCSVYAIDRDPNVRVHADRLSADFPGRFRLVPGCFGDMDSLLAAENVAEVDGVVLDIGVSSMQLDEAARGFSFQADGPLDMRMGGDGETAADLVNNLEAEALADLIYRYGEERYSRRIARAIVARRDEQPFARTRELAEIVQRAVPKGKATKGKVAIHPATRTFQALRIAVNDELGELERGLGAAERLLKVGGRLVVVSFHSLEDRVVKTFLKARAGESGGTSRYLPETRAAHAPTFTLLTRKAVQADEAETSANPRARSAKLRAAKRTSAPAWPTGVAA